MTQFDITGQKRITFLSVYSTLEGDYDAALEVVGQMESDGFFNEGKAPASRSSGRSGTSNKRTSSSKSSKRGSSGFSGELRNPDGPPTDPQVRKVLSLTDDYTEDELYDMTKQEVSDLIQDLLD